MGALNEMGGGYPGYRLSKTALNGLSALIDSEIPEISVNSICPGWVKTDMGGSGALRSVEQGADTITWLATTADPPHGKFLRDRKVIDW
jgi:NAD(P)-dependent dehydrogenase (short-subunit alcohol dehydrogenase family)